MSNQSQDNKLKVLLAEDNPVVSKEALATLPILDYIIRQ